LFGYEAQLAKQSEGEERSKNIQQNVGAVADYNAANGGVVSVIRKDGAVLDPSSENIRGQHKQRLANPVPAIEASAASMETKLRVFVGKDLRV
jgi:hypothetical protein